MLLVIIARMRPGRICLHSSKIPLLWVNHKTRGTMTWAITTWPTIVLRRTGIVIMVSLTMLELLRTTLPKCKSTNQPMCVLPSLYCIQISNQTLHQRTSTHSTTQVSTLQLALLKPSSMNGLTRTPFLMDQPLNTSRGSRSTTCTSQIYRFPRSIWNLALPVESRWSSPSKWLTFELDLYWIGFFF
jgi:hypothetical protein